jgi:hypothetical protein
LYAVLLVLVEQSTVARFVTTLALKVDLLETALLGFAVDHAQDAKNIVKSREESIRID